MNVLRIALAQINVTVGDFEGNGAKIIASIEQAKARGADLIAFPELAICGYPPEDLLLRLEFIQANQKTLATILPATKGITAIVGFVHQAGDTYNAAAVAHDGKLAGVYHKVYLPNYAVFDEERYFRSGRGAGVFIRDGTALGVSVCEDIWYPAGPPEIQAFAGDAEVLINISASPYHIGKGAFREKMLSVRAADNVAIVAFCNLVGGQDELVFDGNSVIFDARGDLIARAKQFEEDVLIADVNLDSVLRQRLHDPRRRKQKNDSLNTLEPIVRAGLEPLATKTLKPPIEQPLTEKLGAVEEAYRALVLGTRDYVGKNGFRKVVIGLSGGIDSSLVAVIAVEALGKENVVGVRLPSRFTSSDSLEDAARLAENLGIELLTISIDAIYQGYLDTFAAEFSGRKADKTEENIQARIRGNFLMALSNKFGWLGLTTGNKSEMSVGYATLYGDMAGGFAVIKDVPKTLVYRLAEYRHSVGDAPVIPRRVLDKAPTAELRLNQKDTDSLPPYDVLDPILQAYIEEDHAPETIVASGFDRALVERVVKMVDQNEYKRRQAPPGVRISQRAFGRDRRLPITKRLRI